jgi:hypothetical protein
MKTFGEYVTSRPCACSRSLRASAQSSSSGAATRSAATAGLYAARIRIARILISLLLLYLAGIGVLAGVSILTGEDGDLTETIERMVAALWLLSAALFAAAAVLVFRRPLTGRALGAIVVVLVLGGVAITVNPYFGAPVTAAAVLAAVSLVR